MLQRLMRFKWVIAGALTTMLFSGGLFAILSDNVRIQGNHLDTPAYAAAAHDIRVALIADDGSEECPPESLDGLNPNPAYKEGVIPALVEGTLADDGGFGRFINAPKAVCIANFGRSAGTVQAFVTNLISKETSCEPDEIASGEDDCTAANVATDPGELPSLVKVSASGFGGGPCEGYDGGSAHKFTEYTDGLTWQTSLDSQAVCAVSLAFTLTGTEADMAAAQSDSLDFDLQLVLSDPIPAGG
ncbi:MAG TPA: hypothetical protein VHC63_04785 [Acidimicrobiales bacterium]|nr:hypothetical protein [Acidimicrobiales bacterium]